MIQPLHNYLLIDLDKRPEKIGSIYVPNINNEKSQRATVLAAGPGKYINGELKPCCAKSGDRVILIKYAGVEIDEHIMIRDDDILAIEVNNEHSF